MYFSSITRRRFLTQTGKTALAASIGGTALAACGGDGSSGSSNLTYGWWSNTPAKDNAMKAWIQNFEQANTTIKIAPEILAWASYWDKLQTTTAGGKAYDIIGMSSGMSASYFDEGALVDLSTRSDYQDAIKNLASAALDICKWNGKTYALPIGTSISVLGYSKKLLHDAGVDYPDPVKPMTFTQFMEIGKKISKQGGPYAINPIDILDFDVFTRLEGGQVYDRPINPTKILINSPAGIRGLTDYQSLFTEGIAPPWSELTNGPWSYDIGALETGKIAFARVGAWLFTDMAKNPDYAIAPLFTIQRAVDLGGVNSLAIYKNSKNQDAAWEFIKWAVQTKPEISFAKFSDIPADKAAFNQMSTYIQPADFAQTLIAQFPAYQPSVVTTKTTLSQTFSDIIGDMMSNKLTPTQAAAKMEQQGNAILSAAS